MTIYTLFLYIGLVSLGFWAVLGMGHAKFQKYEVGNPVTWYLQYFMGCLLVFSGFVKAVDPLGTAYKMKDYFVEFKAQGLPFMDFMVSAAVAFSVFMIVVELVVGLLLILGIGGKPNLGINLLMMVFFTFLTGFNYLTGFTPKGDGVSEAVGILQFSKWTAFDENSIRITDCGCFGDFLKLKPVETFLKDILLTGISIYLFRFPARLKSFSFINAKVGRWISTALTLLTTGFCLNNFYLNDAFIDFRPFAEGVNIKAAKEECAKNPPKKDMMFIYLNKTTKQNEKIPANKLPSDISDTTKWKYVNRVDKVLSEGCNSKVMEFKQFPEIEDFTQYPELAASKGYALLAIVPDMDKTNLPAFNQIANLAREADKNDKIPTYGLYFNVEDKNKNGREDEIEAFRKAANAGFYFQQGDEKLVLTIMRADPGLILFHKGTILKKWHHRHIPKDYASIKALMK
jgi:uncharacterized membrane protein YphA (DoxX/SURF4 family)